MRVIHIGAGRMKIMITKSDRERYGLWKPEKRETSGRHLVPEGAVRMLRAAGWQCGEGRTAVQCFLSRDGGAELFLTRLRGHTSPEALLGKQGDTVLLVEKRFSYLFSGSGLSAAAPCLLRLGEAPAELYRMAGGQYILAVTETFVKVPGKGALPGSFALLEYARPFLPGAGKGAQIFLREHAELLMRGSAAELSSRLANRA